MVLCLCVGDFSSKILHKSAVNNVENGFFDWISVDWFIGVLLIFVWACFTPKTNCQNRIWLLTSVKALNFHWKHQDFTNFDMKCKASWSFLSQFLTNLFFPCMRKWFIAMHIDRTGNWSDTLLMNRHFISCLSVENNSQQRPFLASKRMCTHVNIVLIKNALNNIKYHRVLFCVCGLIRLHGKWLYACFELIHTECMVRCEAVIVWE